MQYLLTQEEYDALSANKEKALADMRKQFVDALVEYQRSQRISESPDPMMALRDPRDTLRRWFNGALDFAAKKVAG